MEIILAICACSAFFSLIICDPEDPIITEIISDHLSTASPFWHDNQLFFIDPPRHKLCSYQVERAVHCATIGSAFLSFAAPVIDQPDKFVVGYDNRLLLVTWNSHTSNANPELSFFKNREKFKNIEWQMGEDRISYGTIDPAGRLWFGTMNLSDRTRYGSVWSFSPFIHPYLRQHMHRGVNNLSNGIVWNLHDPTIAYHIDDVHNTIVMYHYDVVRGDFSRFIKIAFNMELFRGHGIDGRHVRMGNMAIDSRGFLWVPLIGGSGVLEVDPYTESAPRFVGISARRVIACAFGGAEGSILYVTTMGYGPGERRPRGDKGGTVFAVTRLGDGVSAYPSRQFALTRIRS